MQALHRLAHAHQRVVLVDLNGGQVPFEFYDFADEACRADPLVDYFPAFEIITGPQARGAFWAPGLREVTPEGVAAVMAVFRRHYLAAEALPRAPAAAPAPAARDAAAELSALGGVLCEEEALDR